MGVYYWISYRWIVTNDICLPCLAQVQTSKANKITDSVPNVWFMCRRQFIDYVFCQYVRPSQVARPYCIYCVPTWYCLGYFVTLRTTWQKQTG